jgi:hypothetical protein
MVFTVVIHDLILSELELMIQLSALSLTQPGCPNEKRLANLGIGAQTRLLRRVQVMMTSGGKAQVALTNK